MRMMLFVIALTIIASGQASAATIDLFPIVNASAEDFDGDGVFETPIPASPTSDLQTVDGFSQEIRAALEFDISSIPQQVAYSSGEFAAATDSAQF